jgi:hypothetical protein
VTDAAHAAALAQIKQSLVDNAGNYLRNTVRLEGETCTICAGARMTQGHSTCYPCGFSPSNTADLVGSMIYAADDLQILQSGKLMYNYKLQPPVPLLVKRVTSLVALGLRGHIGCADALVGQNASHWATVPSLRDIGAEHPFRKILIGIIGDGREIKVAASEAAKGKTVQERREVNPSLYELQTVVPRGEHVFVVDDTWTSGGHARSVAMALKQAGAAKVSILTVARWLDFNDPRTVRVYNQHIKNRPYDPDICPWTGAGCPPQ